MPNPTFTGASYDLPHSNRIKVKKTTAKTDQTSYVIYVTLEMECDAFYFFFFSFSLTCKISFLLSYS